MSAPGPLGGAPARLRFVHRGRSVVEHLRGHGGAVSGDAEEQEMSSIHPSVFHPSVFQVLRALRMRLASPPTVIFTPRWCTKTQL